MVHLDYLRDGFWWTWEPGIYPLGGSYISGHVLRKGGVIEFAPPYGGRWTMVARANTREEARAVTEIAARHRREYGLRDAGIEYLHQAGGWYWEWHLTEMGITGTVIQLPPGHVLGTASTLGDAMDILAGRPGGLRPRLMVPYMSVTST